MSLVSAAPTAATATATATAVLSFNGTPQLLLPPGAPTPVPAGPVSAAVRAGDATQRVMRLLGCRVRLQISDGRVIVGTFHCLDKHENVILTDAREYLPLPQVAAAAKRGKDKKKSASTAKSSDPAGPALTDEEIERRELWKTGPGRNLGMTLVPGKHLVYVKTEGGESDGVGLL